MHLGSSSDSELDKTPEITTQDTHKSLQNRYPDIPSDYYIPEDPWFIRARLLKEGVLAPGTLSSAHSSRSDFDEFRRRVSLIGGFHYHDDKPVVSATAGGHGSMTDSHLPPSSATTSPHPSHFDHGVWVFVDIQLYQLETNNYMVDFKCDGYQNVIRVENEEGGSEWRPISKRIRNKEKEVTSPYPFLDVASDLVAQLAVAT